MSNKRKKYSAQENVRRLRLHRIEKEPVSDICDAHGLNPNVFYRYQAFTRCNRHITPRDKLQGRAKTFLASRDTKLAAAREARKTKRRASCKKNDLTIIEEMVKMPLAGETETGSAEQQPARDSLLGYRRNGVMTVPNSRGCRIHKDISEISQRPEKTPCRRQGSLLM